MRYLCDKKGCSVRCACRVVGISRSALSYKERAKPDEDALTERIKSLAGTNGRYGYRRITALLHREGKWINIKRSPQDMEVGGIDPARKTAQEASVWA